MATEQTLVVLTPGFPASEEDSTCLPMQQQFLSALQKQAKDWKIIVLALQYPYFLETYYWNEIPVTSFNGRNRGAIRKLLLRKKVFRSLRQLLDEKKQFSLLSFWLGECAWIGKRFADRHQLRHYCWILGQDARKTNDYIHKIKPRGGELVALSDFLQDELEKNHGIRPAHVVIPGINKKLSHTVNQRDISILAVGSLIPLKQFHLFIETIAALKKQFPEIRAVLTGDGPEKNRLARLINKLDLDCVITLTGELGHKEVLSLMQRSKILLHPSSYEGFSGVCMEALSNGCSVISFCKPMHRDYENWYIVKNKEEMMVQANELLQLPAPVSRPEFPLEATVRSMLQLFSKNL